MWNKCLVKCLVSSLVMLGEDEMYGDAWRNI